MFEPCPKCGLELFGAKSMTVDKIGKQDGPFRAPNRLLCLGTDSVPCLRRQLQTAKAEIARLKAIDDRLAHTADGQPVIADGTQYWSIEQSEAGPGRCVCPVEVHTVGGTLARCTVGGYRTLENVPRSAGRLYSSREAAEAAARSRE